MIETFIENLQTLGPAFIAVWAVTLLCVLIRPQKYFNSILLLFSLLVSLIFLAGFFGEDGAGIFLMFVFLLAVLVLFMVPIFLITNGIQMIRKERVSLAHLLSLFLGLFVGFGEIATVLYVMGIVYKRWDMEVNYWFFGLGLSVFYFSLLVLSFVLYSIFIEIMPHRMNFNYVIIHGCGLADGERLTKLLSNRVDKAIQIYQKCKEKPIIIPSGGKGSDEKISEAEAMKRYLLEKGIPEEHIILEDQSTTTRENLLNSKLIIDGRKGKKKTALVSSNYHVYRCLRLAKDVGFDCIGVGAPVAFYYWPSALIREFIAVFLTKRFLIWALLGYLALILPFIYIVTLKR